MLTLEVLPQAFSVCKLTGAAGVDLSRPFTFFARTDREISLVCPQADAPAGALAREDGWRALRVTGAMDLSLVGVLAGLSGTLADGGVSLFAVSTYDTDYILVRAQALEKASALLRGAGYEVL